MRPMSGLLQIGEFALLAGVSVKTLRFYSDQGLLKPVSVDPRTGYRYYAKAQVADATRILNLREAGVSLGDIRAMLAQGAPDGGAVAALLETQRLSLLKERAAVESRLRIVEGLLASVARSGPEALAELRVVSIDPAFVYALRETIDGFGDTITELFEEAERAVAEAGARANRPPFLIIHNPESKGPITIEVCIPVTDQGVSALPARLVGGERIACSLTYTGGYEQTTPLRRQLQAQLKEAGLEPAGPLREVYHRFGARREGYDLPKRVLAASRDKYVTELLMAASLASDRQQ